MTFVIQCFRQEFLSDRRSDLQFAVQQGNQKRVQYANETTALMLQAQMGGAALDGIDNPFLEAQINAEIGRIRRQDAVLELQLEGLRSEIVAVDTELNSIKEDKKAFDGFKTFST